MFNLIDGAKFDFISKLKENYEINGEWIYANVSAEKILPVFNAFIESEVGCRFCLFIEIPSNIKDENPLGVSEDGWYHFQEKHVDVYYLDNISADYLIGLLNTYGEILVNDGLSHFGILSQSRNEIGKYKYNVIKAYSPNGSVPKLTKSFEDFGLTETENLITAWDYFSAEHYGESKVIKVNGTDIYDIVDMLCEVGMYKYEQRED